MTEPSRLVSVMIGAYNAEPYVAEAIDSVLLRLAQQARGGNGAARNTAVSLAGGDYLAFLDADDRFTPRKLELQMAALDADAEVDMVFGHVEEFVSPELDEDV